jgi:hypothetical protein
MAKNVFYFNPTCELAIANGSFSYVAPQLLRDFEENCSVLPFIFSQEDDYVLTENKPSLNFTQKLTQAGFKMPIFATMKELMNVDSFNQLLPWGWSPAAHFVLKPLKEKCSFDFVNSPVFNWKNEHQLLFERKTSLDFLNTLLENHPMDIFVERENTGTIVNSFAEIEILLKRQHALVLKAPLSSSGRGIQMIRKAELNTSNIQWIRGVMNQQGYLIAESYHEKITDLSFQFSISHSGEAEYLGYSVFETNSNGQYKNTLILPQAEGLEMKAFDFPYEEMIKSTAPALTSHLKNSVFTKWHRGYLGIDAMIYKNHDGIKIQPCIEINSRMNMGILTMQARHNIHPEAHGKFELFYGKKGAFEHFARQMEHDKSLKFKDDKPFSGFLALTEPDASKQFGAYILLE